MALCLGNSLVCRHGFVPYDQLVRYKWWYRHGYMSSTGQCFDIGAATSQSISVFENRQIAFARKCNIPLDKLDYLSDIDRLQKFKVHCSKSGVAGNGALMRLAPVPLFFHKHPFEAIYFSGYSGVITHGDEKVYDACRYYAALIFAALNGYRKEELLDKDFYAKHKDWFDEKPFCHEIKRIAEGSYKKKGGYDDGIRGKGYIVDSLEAALWAFWSDGNSFEVGALAAVNLGDDTDTTACIYGQLAGAYYGYKELPRKWIEHVYAKKFILNLSKWIAYEGENWQRTGVILPLQSPSFGITKSSSVENLMSDDVVPAFVRPRSKSRSETLPLGKKAEHYAILPSAMGSTPISGNNMTSDQNSFFPPNSNDPANLNVTKKPTPKKKISEYLNLTPKIRRKNRNANPTEKETKMPTEDTHM
jgi:ADP-ribosyl-[dinitrogen reductase] hydrolase